jgi:hypothetical protein
MRRVLSGVLLLSPLVCVGGPLLTITCEPVKGVGQDYGPTAWERAVAKADNKPRPPTKFSGAHDAAVEASETYILDSSRAKITRLYHDTEETKKAREDAKTLNLPPIPPPRAYEVEVVRYSPEFITAVERGQDYITVFSFYPALGMMFESGQTYDLTGPSASQSAFFAKCEYSWSGKP